MQLDVDDVVWPQEVDAEILGQGKSTLCAAQKHGHKITIFLGAVMAFSVITPMILLAYATEGRKTVQATSLDLIFCFVAAATLIAAGGELFDLQSISKNPESYIFN